MTGADLALKKALFLRTRPLVSYVCLPSPYFRFRQRQCVHGSVQSEARAIARVSGEADFSAEDRFSNILATWHLFSKKMMSFMQTQANTRPPPPTAEVARRRLPGSSLARRVARTEDLRAEAEDHPLRDRGAFIIGPHGPHANQAALVRPRPGLAARAPPPREARRPGGWDAEPVWRHAAAPRVLRRRRAAGRGPRPP